MMKNSSLINNSEKSKTFNRGLIVLIFSMVLAAITLILSVVLIFATNPSLEIISALLVGSLLLIVIGLLVGVRQVLIQTSKLNEKINALKHRQFSYREKGGSSATAQDYSEDFLDLAFTGMVDAINEVAKKVDKIEQEITEGASSGVSVDIGYSNPRLSWAQNKYLKTLSDKVGGKETLVLTDEDSVVSILDDPRIFRAANFNVVAIEKLSRPVTTIVQFDQIVLDIEKVNKSELPKIVPFAWIRDETMVMVSDGKETPQLSVFEELNYGTPVKLAFLTNSQSQKCVSVLRSLGDRNGKEGQ